MKKIDQGIILKRSNYSDTSIILTLLTRRSGLQRFIFQGGKKKSAAIYPMSPVEFAFYRRPDSDLGKLTSVDAMLPASNIPFDPVRSSIAFFLADVILQTCKTEEPDEPLFDLLFSLVKQLDEGHDLPMLPVSSLVLLSGQLGIQPQLKGEEPVYFILDEGEFRAHVPPGALMDTGKHIGLLSQLILHGEASPSGRDTRLKALMTFVKYFELHIPGFNVKRSLEIVRETLA